jgi:hypothetical protein
VTHQLSNDDQMRLIGAMHEAVRVLVCVRQELGRIRERKRLTPEHHVKRRRRLDEIASPLEALERRISAQHQEMLAACKEQKQL